jgi:uncharacterized membrane protein (DUF441 family)
LTEGSVILAALAVAGAIGRNALMVVCALILLALRLVHADGAIRWLGTNGTNVGVFLMILALLAPVAADEVGLRRFRAELTSPAGVFAILLAAVGAYLGRRGVEYLAAQPQVLVGLVAGSVLGTLLLKGVPTGPLILAGLTSLLAGLWKVSH